ncbi:MAG: phosphatidylglycerol lysyltransferase domain-containing protein, partial [Pseudomonadota bacterium]
ALGCYDVIIHRHLRTGCGARHAGLSGAASIAIGQTVGLGILSGALVRWRLLPGIGLLQAIRVATGVAVTFLFGLALSLGVTGLLMPSDILPTAACVTLLFAFFTICLAAFIHPEIHIFEQSVRLPSLRALIGIAALTLVDTLCAGLALWILLPQAGELPVNLLIPAYMLALGAALVSGAPGGIGAFELTLFAVLPQVPDTDLLCGLVAFRVVYYAVPAIMAVTLLLRPFTAATSATPHMRAVQEQDLTDACRAEFGLARQPGATVLVTTATRLLVLPTGQSLCALFGPFSGSPRAALSDLARAARAVMQTPLVYKADARLAVIARRAGWRVLHVADDMVLDVSGFRTEGRAYSQLRRKLRHAAKAKIVTSHARTLPWGVLAEIDVVWQHRHGTARGLTMGRFCPVYLSHQTVFVARQNGTITAFASFHATDRELCLDLVRTRPDTPDGTVHALVIEAVRFARTTGRDRVSLAALPPKNGPVGWLAERTGTHGLRQFKDCFSPKRIPRYALGPGWVGLMVALVDLWRAMRRPNRNSAQEVHEEYEFARAREV